MLKVLENLIIAHGALAVFFVGILEDILFFVPSSLVFLGAGFLLIPAGLTFWPALGTIIIKIGLPATAGVTLGSLIVYGPVYVWGKPVVIRYGKYIGVTWEDVETFQKKIASSYSDEIVLFFLRAIPVIPLSIASVVAGLVRMPFKEFISMTFLGIMIRAIVCAAIGWNVGKSYIKYAAQFETVERYGLLVVVIGCLAAYWYLKRHLKKRN